MLKVYLIRPGATDFDEQGRIRGTLDIPLCKGGKEQVARVAEELSDHELDCIYTAPCQAALQTADALAMKQDVKVKRLIKLKNLDHGLWHGKLMDEVKTSQPKTYRQLQEHPESVSLPEGESIEEARGRARQSLNKLLKKHKQGAIALVVSEPLATLVGSLLADRSLGDMWK